MSSFLDQLQTVLAAAATGRLPLIHQLMPRHLRVWLAGISESERSPRDHRWRSEAEDFVEHVYPEIVLLMPSSDGAPSDLVDEAIQLRLCNETPSGALRIRLGYLMQGLEITPGRHLLAYAARIGLLAPENERFGLTRAGEIIWGQLGWDRIRLLLALETLRAGPIDRHLVSRELCDSLLAGAIRFDFDKLPSPDDEPFSISVLRRLADMGVVYSWSPDGYLDVFDLGQNARELMKTLASDRASSLQNLARSLLDDQEARLTGRSDEASATEAAMRQSRLIAHEVRNAMLPIQAALGRARQAAPHSDLDRVAQGLDRINHFVDEMASTARLVGGGGTFSLAAAVRDTIDEAAAQFDRRARFDDPGHAWHIEGDILRNAWQMRGDATVDVRLLPLADGRIRVAIDDDGPGVPQNLRVAIFAEGVGLRDGGSGMGLAIARRIIDEMHGTLRCTESPSGGARFLIDLPLVEGES